MRLLYIWIKEDKNKILKEKNFNFTDAYHFEYDEKTKNLILLLKETIAPQNFFNICRGKNNVNMINAIIGNNGAGKTTLLKHLFEVDMLTSQDENYKYWDTIQIFEKVDKKENKIFLYHNVPITNIDKLLKKYPNIKDIYVNDANIKSKEIAKEMSSGFESTFSKIYLSNSSFENLNNLYSWKTIKKIGFTDYDLNTVAREFFDISKLTEIGLFHEDQFYAYNKSVLHKDRPLSHYIEGFLFLNFYKYIQNVQNKTMLDALGFYNHLKITACNTVEEILNNKNEINFIKNNDMAEIIKNVFNKIEPFSIIDNLYSSLYLEVLIAFSDYQILSVEEISTSNKKDTIKGKIKTLLELIVSKLDEMQSDSTPAVNGRLIVYCEYYKRAFNILSELEKDNSFKNNEIFVKEMNNKTLDLLCNEIQNNRPKEQNRKCVEIDLQKEPSFVLKYLFVGSYLSSGERALYRFLSWIYSCINADVFVNRMLEKPLGENILLLIDEIDLYCHPEWQRQMSFYLTNCINTFFPNKHFHVIYSSHSPITLSDLPSQYTLKLKDGSLVNNNEQTFCANIYDLLHDSFFLDNGFIGEFATKKINEII